ncbi:cyclophilin-like domain-containing protein [Lobosporangium transversale]|uniref:Peptidyl-prolyl cis-trans isomerase n=1 Tax=Lobosporangium transversale TaxID=64571 RepID=A0A1Y2GTS9_9FUNG|nr:cyclophilin-like domain-containing protein [Lobosporangium transversale]ORZ21012.1 cyclophilin-like domain-containing protein [Lobosporangium transversale]|eukprot:XP_021882921.1 cyclophilin-like domain-containing protein [Lobosporangium transversale]
MSVLIETSVGDVVIDLYIKEAPETCLNFLKLCKVKYYNFCCFHNVQRDFMIQTGDPTATGHGGESIYGLLDKTNSDPRKKYLPAEINPKLKHKEKGTVSMAIAGASTGSNQEVNSVLGSDRGAGVIGSQFFITMANDLDYLDGRYTIFGKVAEGMDVLEKINSAYTDSNFRPFKDIRIKHTIILEDPFPDPEGLEVPDESPLPTQAMLDTVRIGDDEEIESLLPPEEEERIRRLKEAQARALTLEMVGDLPFAEIKPPENVLFVAQLNPATRSEDLELIFSRFGLILSCEVIRDKRTGDSLCYAFIEFEKEEDCSEAYFKMNNVLIDDRRIHVDFSQSVSKLHKDWMVKKVKSKQGGGGVGIEDLNLEQRSRYRDEDRSSGRSGYDYVFDDKQDSRRSGKSHHSSRDNRQQRDRGSRHDSSSSRNQHRRRSRSRSASPGATKRTDGRDRDREWDRDRGRDRDRDRDRDRNRDRDRDRDSHRSNYRR